jgi:hypothetical protein
VPATSFVTGDKFAAPNNLAPHDARLQLGQSLRRDNFLALPSTRDGVPGLCPVLAPDAPDAAVRIFDSVGAGSGNTTSPYYRAVRAHIFVGVRLSPSRRINKVLS